MTRSLGEAHRYRMRRGRTNSRSGQSKSTARRTHCLALISLLPLTKSLHSCSSPRGRPTRVMLCSLNRLKGLAAPLRTCTRTRAPPPPLYTTRIARPFSSSSVKRAGPRYVRFGSDPQQSGGVQRWDTRTRVLVGIIAAGGVYYVTQCVSAFWLTSCLLVDRPAADIRFLGLA